MNDVELCSRMLGYAAVSSALTADKTASQIKEALGFFFTAETIARAVAHITDTPVDP